MAELVQVIWSLLIGSVGPIVFVWWDERRLSPEAQERAWPLSTRLAAGIAFGPLCLPVHFFRTRRTVVGTLLGFATMIAFIAAIIGLSYVTELVMGD